MKIAVIGMGRLGYPMAKVCAEKGVKVYGIDKDLSLLKKLRKEKVENLLLTDKYSVVKKCKFVFIFVGTQVKGGGYSIKPILKVCDDLKKYLNKDHVVVLRSTVLPGDCDRIYDYLKKGNKKKFGFCYNPEFLRLGSVEEDFLNPQFVLIGGNGEKYDSDTFVYFMSFSGRKYIEHPTYELMNFYRYEIGVKTIDYCRVSFANAEIIKLMINFYLTMKISFSNLVGELAEKYDKANVDLITKIIGMDKRIGNRYLKAGLGYGGTCLPKDVNALEKIMLENIAFYGNGIGYDFINAIKCYNVRGFYELKKRIVNILKHQITGKKIGVIGVAFKSGTSAIDYSFGSYLIDKLWFHMAEIYFYDRNKDAENEIEIKKGIHKTSITRCLKDADMVVITQMEPVKDINKLVEQIAKSGCKNIFDCWRILKGHRGDFKKAGINYYAVGVKDA